MPWIFNVVLNSKLNINNIFIFSEHQRFLRNCRELIRSSISAIAHFNRPDLLDIDDFNRLYRVGCMPSQPRFGYLFIVPKSEFYTLFALFDHVKTRRDPQ